ncbi:MAG: carboxypeptidase-like regulatory domain-containing protein, partial [Duncaniella sp.]|nr:carboxypeptidase-like regulatory domain-containing protein [Duncaniella sp.]
MPKNRKECGFALRVAVAAATLVSFSPSMSLSAQSSEPVKAQSVAATGMGLAKSTASIITGKVSDSQGEPLAGAAVVTDSKGLGALTNADGVYVIKVPSSAKVTSVTASFVGMKPLTLPAPTDGKPLDFTLSEDGNQLSEVVVTGLFDRKASSFTGSAATYS